MRLNNIDEPERSDRNLLCPFEAVLRFLFPGASSPLRRNKEILSGLVMGLGYNLGRTLRQMETLRLGCPAGALEETPKDKTGDSFRVQSESCALPRIEIASGGALNEMSRSAVRRGASAQKERFCKY